MKIRYPKIQTLDDLHRFAESIGREVSDSIHVSTLVGRPIASYRLTGCRKRFIFNRRNFCIGTE